MADLELSLSVVFSSERMNDADFSAIIEQYPENGVDSFGTRLLTRGQKRKGRRPAENSHDAKQTSSDDSLFCLRVSVDYPWGFFYLKDE